MEYSVVATCLDICGRGGGENCCEAAAAQSVSARSAVVNRPDCRAVLSVHEVNLAHMGKSPLLISVCSFKGHALKLMGPFCRIDF